VSSARQMASPATLADITGTEIVCVSSERWQLNYQNIIGGLCLSQGYSVK
jgi:hypothetical protein